MRTLLFALLVIVALSSSAMAQGIMKSYGKDRDFISREDLQESKNMYKSRQNQTTGQRNHSRYSVFEDSSMEDEMKLYRTVERSSIPEME